MKSAQIKKYGSEVEINQSVPEPIISAGKVLVIVKAAGVNQAVLENCCRLYATNVSTPIPINLRHGFFWGYQTGWRRSLSFRF